MEILTKSDIYNGSPLALTGEVDTEALTGTVSEVLAYSSNTGLARYTLTGLSHNIRNLINHEVTIAGCANAENNGTWVVKSIAPASGYIYLVNPAAVTENPVGAGTIAGTFVVNMLHMTTLGGGGGLSADIQGTVSNDAVDGTSKPVKIGGQAKALEQTAVSADGDRVNAAFDLYGKQKVVSPAFVTREYDYTEMTYVTGGTPADGEIDTIIYKAGGSGGTTVATLTMDYDPVTGDLLSVTKS